MNRSAALPALGLLLRLASRRLLQSVAPMGRATLPALVYRPALRMAHLQGQAPQRQAVNRPQQGRETHRGLAQRMRLAAQPRQAAGPLMALGTESRSLRLVPLPAFRLALALPMVSAHHLLTASGMLRVPARQFPLVPQRPMPLALLMEWGRLPQ